MPFPSPYKGVPEEKWHNVTKELIRCHPLSSNEIVEVVLKCWDSIFDSCLGTRNYRIGKDIFPKPQIMGFLLHQFIALELEARYPGLWKGEEKAGDKDLVYIPDDKFSIEIKTSSNPARIFGNRSYAQKAKTKKKSKEGYYLAINFEKFSKKVSHPEILLIRFGWIDAEDWIGQKAASGQQARLNATVETRKLIEIYSRSGK